MNVTQTNAVTLLQPDLAEAARFLAALDRGPNARFGFAAFDDNHNRGDFRRATRLYGDLNQSVRLTGPKRGQTCSTAGMLSFMQGLGAGVFVTVQRTDGHGATAAHVTDIRALFADADDDGQLACLRRFTDRSGLEPSIVVESGGITTDDPLPF